ncbi:MAG: polysaccharide deacetylase family protein [Planctomycetaceae bacterium]|nr:polysaccharide deacetylase family protein [Planctomycetaceae bacterium]
MRRLRWIIRDILLITIYYSGLAALWAALWGRRSGILSYHNVLAAGEMSKGFAYRVDCTIEVFESQVAYLARHYPILPARMIGQEASEGWILTFDDGMLNAYSTIAPILSRRNLTAIFAVCPGLIEGDIPHVWRDHIYLILQQSVGRSLRLPMDHYGQPVAIGADNINAIGAAIKDHVVSHKIADVYRLVRTLCECNALPYHRETVHPERFSPMDWPMVRSLQAAGHVIASHTWSHRILSLLPDDQKREELQRSRAMLAARLGQAPEVIVYPYGGPAEVDQETMTLAAECNYRVGLMNVPARVPGPDAMAVPRFGLPPTPWRAHLFATLCGVKHALKGT